MSAGQSSDELAPGSSFGRYRIVRLVGHGAMGHVYEATLTDLQKRVALKIMQDHQGHAHEERRVRFLREARAAARVQHTNVVEIFDVGVHEGMPFLAMEYLGGSDLRASFELGPLDLEQLLAMIMPVMAGVHAAHQSGVIHRDLKPENIFISLDANGDTRPMVVDFGISKLLEGNVSQVNMTATASVMGTPLYMSPEQARSAKDVDARSDQYALAVILYEGVSGHRPFNEDSIYTLMLEKIAGEVTPLSKRCPHLEKSACAAIMRAMSVDRAERFHDVKDFGAALLPFCNERTRLLCEPWFGVRAGTSLDAVAASGSVGRSTAPAAPIPETGGRPNPADRVLEGLGSSTLRASAHEVNPLAAPKRRNNWIVVASASAAVLLGVGVLYRKSVTDVPATAVAKVAMTNAPAPIETFSIALRLDPPNTQADLDGVPLAHANVPQVLARDGREHTLRLSAEGYEPKVILFRDQAPPQEIALEPVPPPPPPPVTPPLAQPPKLRIEKPKREPAAAERLGSNNAPILY